MRNPFSDGKIQRFLNSLYCLWDSEVETGVEFAWNWISCLRYLLQAKSVVILQVYVCARLSWNILGISEKLKKISLQSHCLCST